MLKIVSSPVWFAALIASALAACSPTKNATVPSPEQPREFSAEDKRAARSLSISNNQAVMNADSPYARALLCRNGIEVLADQFQKARGLSDEQRQGMEQARTYFDDQLSELGQRAGKSKADMKDDLEKVVKENVDPAENARIASACLRRLLETG